MLKLLAHLLLDLGFGPAITCDNGAEALQCVDSAERAPDLILLDLNMPDMDGVEFVRELVERGYGGSLILVSGEDERVLHMAKKLIQAHQVNVLGHLSKPVLAGRAVHVDGKIRPQRAASASAPARRPTARNGWTPRSPAGNWSITTSPRWRVATGAVVGVETLVRWRHPQDGLVFPDQFIGLAEEHGLIDALTRAVHAAMPWRQAGVAAARPAPARGDQHLDGQPDLGGFRRIHRQRGARRRRRPAGHHPGGDGKPPDARPARTAGNPHPPAHEALSPVDRRFRHRAFLAGAVARHFLRRTQDRPQLRA